MSENSNSTKGASMDLSLEGFNAMYERNKKNINMVLGAVGVVVVGWLVYKFAYADPRNRDANEALWRIENWAQMDSINWVLDGNDEGIGAIELMDQFGGTLAAEKATFYAACAKREKGDYQGALDLFLEVNLNDNAVGIQAIGNAGDMYVELNQLDDAAEYLEKAARKAQASASQDVLAPLYYLKAARVQMERQDNQKAIALLTEIVDNFKRSPEYGDALKAKAYLESMSK
jgi:tetratricopeptide (TPR) repeat protein